MRFVQISSGALVVFSLIVLGCESTPAPGSGSGQNPPDTPIGNGGNSCTASGIEAVEAINEELGEIVSDDEAKVLQVNAEIERVAESPLGLQDAGDFEFQMTGLMQKRARLLRESVKRNPGILSKSQLSAQVRAFLPHPLQGCLEDRVTRSGRLEVLVSFSDTTDAPIEYFLEDSTTGARYTLHFEGKARDLQTDDQVQVTGLNVPSCGTDISSEPIVIHNSDEDIASLALSTVPPGTFGAQKTLVLLLSFADRETAYTQAQAQSVVFDKVHRFFLENSYNQAGLTGKVIGPLRIASSSAGCDSNTIAVQANAAATGIGENPSNYRRIVYVFPSNGCGWLGLGTIGGNPSRSWINGSMVLHTVAHELGHNFGLYHANALSCGTSTIGGSCATIEYGDTSDAMGNRLAGHFNAFQKERIGWLDFGSSPKITQAQANGVYEIDATESTTSRVKALKILKSTDGLGKKTYYYLEYRQGLGFDQVLANPVGSNLTSGVIVHTGSETTGNSSFMLNMNPSLGSWYKAALNVGQTFNDSNAGVSFSVVSISSGIAKVQVAFTSQSSLAVTGSATKPVYAKGELIPVTVRAENNGIAALGATYLLEVTEPSGHKVIKNGSIDADGTVVQNFRSTNCSESGTYAVSVSASLNGSSGFATTSFQVH